MRVAAGDVERARARMLDLFPAGFEERGEGDVVELAAYTDAAGERALGDAALGPLETTPVEPGWEDAWRAFHRPTRIGPLWVGPPWLEPDADALAVVIDPGRAFGTGAHATTRLCLELLTDLERGSLLDLGCGSGVLAIAAAKLGFRPVVALDADPLAVDATRANAAANGVDLDVRRADVLADALPDAELAVANIELGAVQGLARRVRSTRLVTSGYLEADVPALPRWTPVRRAASDGWAADLYVAA